jgi:hypothetical protein
MKTPIYLKTLALFLATTQLANASNCTEGGSCGGGGNRVTATEAEVQKAVDEINDIEFAIRYFASSEDILNPTYVSDPILKRALERMVRTREVIGDQGKEYWRDNGILYQPGITYTATPILKEKCTDDYENKEVEASTVFGSGNAEICINKKMLMKYGKDELRLQLGVLVYHERLHLIQPKPNNKKEREALEAEAKALQDHLLKNLKGIFPYVDHLTQIVNEHKRKNADKKAYSYSFGIRILTLRPNGKTKLGNITIGCKNEAVNLYNLDDRLNMETDLTVAPGGVVVVRDKNSKGKTVATAISCLDMPPVRCRLSQFSGNTYALHVGDKVQSYSREWGLRTLEKFREAGICAKEKSKSEPQDSDESPSSNEVK